AWGEVLPGSGGGEQVGWPVEVAVVGELVPAVDDRADRVRVLVGGPAGRVERAPDLPGGQELEDSRQPPDDPEATLGECREAGGLGESLAEEDRLCGDVERPRHRCSAPVGPGVPAHLSATP